MTSADREPVLIFGGSFDPPTMAHIQMPLMAAKAIGARGILFVPAKVSPHKLDAPPVDAAHRLAMIELATADHAMIELELMELRSDDTSFTIDTITALRNEFGERVELRLLIGDDQAVLFNTWKSWQEIISIAPPAVMPRVCSSAEAFADLLRHQGTWSPDEIIRWMTWRLDLPLVDSTSTVARSKIAAGEDVSELLDPAVLTYLTEHCLYR